jgi:hypothetical protein
MAQTLSDLVTATLMNDFDRTTYIAAAKQAILDGAADVGNQIALDYDFKQTTLTYTNGTNLVALPATIRRVESITDLNGNLLTEVDTAWIDGNPNDRGLPTAYAMGMGPQVFVWPTPNSNGTLTLRYVNSFDVSTIPDAGLMVAFTHIPEEYLRALVSFARARLFALEDDPDMAAFWRAEYDRDIGRMKADVQFRSRGRRQRRSIWTRQSYPVFKLPG